MDTAGEWMRQRAIQQQQQHQHQHQHLNGNVPPPSSSRLTRFTRFMPFNYDEEEESTTDPQQQNHSLHQSTLLNEDMIDTSYEHSMNEN